MIFSEFLTFFFFVFGILCLTSAALTQISALVLVNEWKSHRVVKGLTLTATVTLDPSASFSALGSMLLPRLCALLTGVSNETLLKHSGVEDKASPVNLFGMWALVGVIKALADERLCFPAIWIPILGLAGDSILDLDLLPEKLLVSM